VKIAIVGTGYVGLISGVCLAARGQDVTSVDVKPEIVRTLNNGVPHLYERYLGELLHGVVKERRFRATTDLFKALEGAEAVMIAVGTPSNGSAIDLTQVQTAAQEIGRFLRGSEQFLSVIVKSTVIPGTTDTVVAGEIARSSGKSLGQFGLAMNPEFLREGAAVEDFMEPDRIVMGHEDERSLGALHDLYRSWHCDKLCVNTRTAELIKYANNALLATQISAINEIANLAAAIGNIDIMDVVRGVHLDRRWNPIDGGERVNPSILSYLVPGCGFGGSCFPKDVQALCSQGADFSLPMHMLKAVLAVNEAQPLQVVEILEREVGELSGKNVLLLGLAFKPDTDDVRDSASLKIADALLTKNAEITVHDPLATDGFRQAMGAKAARVKFVDDWRPEISRSKIIIIATRWPEYSEIAQMNVDGCMIFDARRMLDTRAFSNARYLSIGHRVV
jgi:UDPglucose 6-dehydrogenase